MTWTEDVQVELNRAQEALRAGNEAKARTSARRAVGIAVEELQKRFPGTTYGRDYISQLRSLASDPAVPREAREAAHRLQARISPDFVSQSLDPVHDAEIILSYVLARLRQAHL